MMFNLKFRVDNKVWRAAGAAVLTAVALLNMPVQSAQAQTAPQCSPAHIVQANENLYRIAVAYKTDWQTLQRLNNIYNPNAILVGQVICLPGSTPPVVVQPTIVIPPTLVVPPTVAPTPAPPIILPTPTAPPVITPVAPAVGIVVPVNVFPSITFNTRLATFGDTLTITGVNFPTNEPVDVYIAGFGTPANTQYFGTPIASATTDGFGRVSLSLTLPSTVGTEAVRGQFLSFLVRGRVTNYYGFNFISNSRPN